MATNRKVPNYLLIGIFMSIGILSMLVSVIFAEKLLTKLRGGYPILVRFSNLDGLVIGSKVIVGSGKSIGQIEKIDLDGSQLIVTAIINKKFQINQDAKFEIFSSSFVGGKYLAVENYTGVAPYLAKGTQVEGTDPITINSILGMFGDAFQSGTDEGMILGVVGIITSVNEIVSTVNNVLQENRTNIDQIVIDVARATKSLNSILANLDRKLSSVSDQEFKAMITDLKGSLNNLDVFLEDINSANAPLSILKDPKITQSIRTIVTNLEETTERVKAKPSLLLRS